MTTAKKRVTAKEVAAAYGETVEEEAKETILAVLDKLDICDHEVADHKKSVYASLFGNRIRCIKCNKIIHLVWISD